MIPGYNQNVRYRDRDFHVQTEDSGLPGATVTTHIYIGGTIIASLRTSYAAVTRSEQLYPLVKSAMEQQHDLMVRNLRSGLYSDGLHPPADPAPCLAVGSVEERDLEPELDDVLTRFVADELVPHL